MDTSKSYFSIIVRADPNASMLDTRMLEATRPDIRELFSSGGRFNLEAMCRVPAVMVDEFREDDDTSVAVVGYIDGVSQNPRITHPVMRVPSRCLLEKGLIDRWWNTRTHWKMLEGDPFKLLADVAIYMDDGPRWHVDSQLAAVMMPFRESASLDNVYITICRGAAAAGYHCRRVDEIATSTDITNDIVDLICRAGVVIADLSGMNPNVMFELGYARGVGKNVVLITSDDPASLPFDIRQTRTIRYHYTTHGLDELADGLARFLGK